MKLNLVSILVVSYNAEKYIEKTLQSCLAQTYLNFEILILDNASIDQTVEIIKSLNDSRITIFEGKENIGPYAGINFLLNQSKGEYIAIQDHDDVWFPEKIVKQVEFLKKNTECIACGSWTYFFFESRDVLILNKKPAYTDFVDHTTLVFRNEGFRYDLNHVLADEYFEKRILSISGKIHCFQGPLVVHRLKKGGGNLSSSRFTFTAGNIYDFFATNRMALQSIQYLAYLFVVQFLPERAVWWIRKNITLRNAEWISVEEFQKRFSEISL